MYTVYGTDTCPYCNMAKDLLQSKGIPYQYINIQDSEEYTEYFQQCGWQTVPQIIDENEKYIGGFTDLREKLNGQVG